MVTEEQVEEEAGVVIDPAIVQLGMRGLELLG